MRQETVVSHIDLNTKEPNNNEISQISGNEPSSCFDCDLSAKDDFYVQKPMQTELFPPSMAKIPIKIRAHHESDISKCEEEKSPIRDFKVDVRIEQVDLMESHPLEDAGSPEEAPDKSVEGSEAAQTKHLSSPYQRIIADTGDRKTFTPSERRSIEKSDCEPEEGTKGRQSRHDTD